MKAKRGLWRAPTAVGAIPTGGVNRENRIIRGFAVVEAGEARSDERIIIDGTTLDKVVELGNALTQGVKMRFGHPQMSDDALGKFAGRAKNFRRDGQKVLADAHFDPSAFIQSPQMAEHIFVRAESDAASFGTSLDLKMTLEKRLNSDGTPQKDPEGNDLLPLVRPTALFGSDFVDSPAATSSLFSGTNVLLSDEATQILDTVLARPDAAERLSAFLDRYLDNRKEDPMPDEPGAAPPASEAQTLFQKLGERLGFGSTAAAEPVSATGPPSPEPVTSPPPVAATGDVSTPLDVAALNALVSAQATQLTSTNEQMAKMMALVEAQAADRQTASMDAFAARIDALVPVTSLSSTAADGVKKTVEAMLPAQLAEAEGIVAGLEGLPRVYDQVHLSEEVTFETDAGGEQTAEVDLRTYGVVQTNDGDFTLADPDAAKHLATARAAKGLDPAAELRMLKRQFNDRGGNW